MPEVLDTTKRPWINPTHEATGRPVRPVRSDMGRCWDSHPAVANWLLFACDLCHTFPDHIADVLVLQLWPVDECVPGVQCRVLFDEPRNQGDVRRGPFHVEPDRQRRAVRQARSISAVQSEAPANEALTRGTVNT